MSEDSAMSDFWTVLIFLVLGFIIGLNWKFIYEKLNVLLSMVTS